MKVYIKNPQYALRWKQAFNSDHFYSIGARIKLFDPHGSHRMPVFKVGCVTAVGLRALASAARGRCSVPPT